MLRLAVDAISGARRAFGMGARGPSPWAPGAAGLQFFGHAVEAGALVSAAGESGAPNNKAATGAPSHAHAGFDSPK